MSQFTKYKVNEIFMSLQGEGFNQGKKVIFIRLSGCNFNCHWCDTDHDSFVNMTIEDILHTIQIYDCKSVIITGGEPTIHNLLPLLKVLKSQNYWIAIESNGSNSMENISPYLDYIAISPKGDILQKVVNEIRIVNDNISVDFLQNIEKTIISDNYYLSPLDIDGIFNIKETMELLGIINQNGTKKWRMSLQLHKLANIQ